jgi:hypothetical protein
MAKKVENFFLDDYLDALATCTEMYVCSAEPANYAGIAAVTLASTTLTAGDGNGDYTIGEGDVSGRKVTVAQQADISITGNGDADHIVLADGTNLWATTCASQTLTSGGTVTVNAFDVEIADPT